MSYLVHSRRFISSHLILPHLISFLFISSHFFSSHLIPCHLFLFDRIKSHLKSYLPFSILISFSVKPVMPAGVRSTSSPNIQDDLLIHGSNYLQPTSKNPRQDLRPENLKESVDKKGFSTVPNRLHADSGPKRSPLTDDLFQGPSISVTGDASIGGSEVKNSQSGSYCLLGIPASKVTAPQPNLELQHQRQKPTDEDARKALHVQSQVQPKKQSEPSKARPNVGAYALVGIPEAGGQIIKPTPVCKPAPYCSNDATGNAAIPVKDKGKGYPVEGKEKPVAEPSYELVGHRHSPGKMVPANPVQQTKLENTSLDVKRDARQGVHGSPLLNRADKQHLVAKSNSLPDVSHRGSADGEAQSTDDVTVGPDLYASVAPKNRNRPDNKGTNGVMLSGGISSLRTQTSSGSLQSFASTSSDGGNSPPAVPEKTNDAFLVPGEEPYEAVQQNNKGTLGDRFKKMVKNNTKGSLPKRLSDLTNPVGHGGNGTSKTNSLGSSNVVVPWDDIGYMKRVDKPKGPRTCPTHWPTFGYLGL